MVIDAHQHFWQFEPVRDSWINDDMGVIRRDFMPDDLKPVLNQNGVDGCVAVQAAQDDAQTAFLLRLAQENPFIRGVVGWVDLQADNLPEQLTDYRKQPLLKGFRHVLQDEPDDTFMLRPTFLKGVQELGKQGFTYDILIFPRHLQNAIQFVRTCNSQPLVLDHLAKPYIKSGLIDEWKKDLTELAAHEYLSCKISGLVTEADWHLWTPEELEPYINAALETFGPNRLLFGSDWPVCLLAGDYAKVKSVVEQSINSLTPSERAAIMGGNATRFYGLM